MLLAPYGRVNGRRARGAAGRGNGNAGSTGGPDAFRDVAVLGRGDFFGEASVPLHDFGTPEHARAVASVLSALRVDSAEGAKVST